MQSIKWLFILLWLSFLTIAFGYIEAAVVVYLRELYYPAGFDFPLIPMSSGLVAIELGRELATLIILVALGMLCGDTSGQRFAWFLYAFAIWDIFYYVFLKMLLNWPAHWLTWDILFLIPTTWVGPVLAPVLLSATMIAFALLIIYAETNSRVFRFKGYPIILLITGSLVVIFSFTWEYSAFMLGFFNLAELLAPSAKPLVEAAAYSYVPKVYPWWLFFLGEVLILGGIYLGWKGRHALQ